MIMARPKYSHSSTIEHYRSPSVSIKVCLRCGDWGSNEGTTSTHPLQVSRERLHWRRLAIGSVRLWSCASIWVWPLSSAGRLDIDGELANCHRLLIRQPNVRFLWWGPEVGKGASVARLLIIPVYMFLIQKRQNNIYKLMRSFSSFWLFKMP